MFVPANEIEELELEMTFGHYWPTFKGADLASRRFSLVRHPNGDEYSFGKASCFLEIYYSDGLTYYYIRRPEPGKARAFWQIDKATFIELQQSTQMYPVITDSKLTWALDEQETVAIC